MKLIVIPKDLDHLDKYSKDVDGFILGVKDLCINFDSEYSISEISNIIDKYPDKEIFVSINKNIFNEELSLLENTLKELDKLKISGVLFYDLSVVYLKNKNNLNIELVWNQNHMVTNYKTCNYYKSLNVNTAYSPVELSSSILLSILIFLYFPDLVTFPTSMLYPFNSLASINSKKRPL